jgi:CobQ-like glutamine amidotransferase family enzyme
MRIEVLYPELASLYGDPGNEMMLRASRPDAEFVRTPLGATPAFAAGNADLVLLGSMTEHGQQAVAEELAHHVAALRQQTEAGTHFLFTGNATDLLGTSITNNTFDVEFAGLGLFDFRVELRMRERINSKFLGETDHEPIVGFKSQFSHVIAPEPDKLEFFAHTIRGMGLREGLDEGVRRHNLIGTHLIGPLLVLNPLFTRRLLTEIDGVDAPLAFEDVAVAAFEARLAELRDPKIWGTSAH